MHVHAVVIFAEMCYDLINRNWIPATPFFNYIGNTTTEKSRSTRIIQVMDWVWHCCWHWKAANNPWNIWTKEWGKGISQIGSGDCLVPTSTTRFAGDLWYRMAKNLIGLYKKILFMNNDLKFLNIEWRTQYSHTNFDEHFGLHASVISYTPVCVVYCTFVCWLVPKL